MAAALVRRACNDDVDALLGLMHAFYAESGYTLDTAAAASSLHALLTAPTHGSVWLALDGEAAVGHAVLCVRHAMEYDGQLGVIDDLYVVPAARRQSIGRRLLLALRDDAQARGCRALEVEVGASNTAARGLYDALGLQARTDDRITLSGPLKQGP
jgi:ribosomal protein S18 acetylase RimI-like enzyme